MSNQIINYLSGLKVAGHLKEALCKRKRDAGSSRGRRWRPRCAQKRNWLPTGLRFCLLTDVNAGSLNCRIDRRRRLASNLQRCLRFPNPPNRQKKWFQHTVWLDVTRRHNVSDLILLHTCETQIILQVRLRLQFNGLIHSPFASLWQPIETSLFYPYSNKEPSSSFFIKTSHRIAIHNKPAICNWFVIQVSLKLMQRSPVRTDVSISYF